MFMWHHVTMCWALIDVESSKRLKFTRLLASIPTVQCFGIWPWFWAWVISEGIKSVENPRVGRVGCRKGLMLLMFVIMLWIVANYTLYIHQLANCWVWILGESVSHPQISSSPSEKAAIFQQTKWSGHMVWVRTTLSISKPKGFSTALYASICLPVLGDGYRWQVATPIFKMIWDSSNPGIWGRRGSSGLAAIRWTMGAFQWPL